jgi:DNA polymerase III epsilon subunit-like protein
MNLTNTSPVFYDCEASCIGGLPIEIGWAYVEPQSGLIKSEGYLIKPPAHWDMKPVWDPDAQKLHGISLDQLAAQGHPPADIAIRMNERLAGRSLVSDRPADDERWLRIIFADAGIEPSFKMLTTRAAALAKQLAANLGLDETGYEVTKDEAERASPTTHRAEADARHWATLWQLLLRQNFSIPLSDEV